MKPISLAETILRNLLAEHELAIASGNTERLTTLKAEIARLREQIAHEKHADFIHYGSAA